MIRKHLEIGDDEVDAQAMESSERPTTAAHEKEF